MESEGGEIEEKDEEKDENGEKDNDEEVEVVEKDFEEVRNTQRGFKAKKAVNEKAKKENDGEKNTIFGFTYVVHSSRGFWRSDGSVISSLPEKLKMPQELKLLVIPGIPGNGNGNHTYKKLS